MTNTEEDDEALIGRYARGDAAAFDQLYRRHELRVWRYLERNVCNQATSDDLLQEIWFALARNAASLESGTRFRTRLFTLAHDRMTDLLRARAAKAITIRRTRSLEPSGNYPASSAKPTYCKSKAN
jgi:RNA polymerase sigma-70 factor (ECF subfamily)